MDDVLGKVRKFFEGEKTIWSIFLLLVALSLVEVFSASSILTYKTGNYWKLLFDQLLYLGLGLILAAFFTNIPARYFRKFSVIGFGISLAIGASTFFIGDRVNGASRWVFGFQPSELIKASLIALVAYFLTLLNEKYINAKVATNLVFIALLASLTVVAKENLSTGLLMFMTVLCLCFIAKLPWKLVLKWLIAIGLMATIAIGAKAIYKNMTEKEGEAQELVHMRNETWGNRIKTFLTPFPDDPKEVDIDNRAQEVHSHIAVASANILGRGPGNSIERDFLSNAFNDFIFAIIIEELGLLGGFFLLALYIIFLFKTGQIANRCKHSYYSYLIMGLAIMIVIQALINMSVAVGLIPVTGLPLPLVGRGGTSIVFNGLYFGIILSVSRFSRKLTAKELREEQRKIEEGIIHNNEPEFRKE